MSTDDLQGLRNEIDAIDQQIQGLLNERASCAKRVADESLKSLNSQGRAQINGLFFIDPSAKRKSYAR